MQGHDTRRHPFSPSPATSSGSELGSDLLDYLQNAEQGQEEQEQEEASSSSGRGTPGLHCFERSALAGLDGGVDGSFLEPRGPPSASCSPPPPHRRFPGHAAQPPLQHGGPGCSTQQATPQATQQATQDVVHVVLDASGAEVEVARCLTAAEAFPCRIRSREAVREAALRAASARRAAGAAGPAAPPQAAAAAGAHRRTRKPCAAGAKGGLLLPGEKAELKRAKRQAKVAAREAARGFDVEREVATVAAFAADEARAGDMMACAPVGKHGQAVLVRAARLLGLRASVKGSGKKQFVTVTRPATGPDSRHAQRHATALQQVDALVEQELRRQRAGAGSAAAHTPHAQQRLPHSARREGPVAGRALQQGSGSGSGRAGVQFVSGGFMGSVGDGADSSEMSEEGEGGGGSTEETEGSTECSEDEEGWAASGSGGSDEDASGADDGGAAAARGAEAQLRALELAGARDGGQGGPCESGGEHVQEGSAQGPWLGVGDDEEEEGAHAGLGSVSACGYTYCRTGFSLGLDAHPGPSAAQHVQHTAVAGMVAGGVQAARGLEGGSAGACGAAGWQQGPLQGAAAQRSGLPFGATCGPAAGSGAAFAPNNRTKQQAKAARKKEAKEARRQMTRGGGVQREGGGGNSFGEASRSTAPADLHYQFASFEQHTTGIGSRLMERMGWAVGTGLRRGGGRSEPLLPHMRPKKLGLGA